MNIIERLEGEADPRFFPISAPALGFFDQGIWLHHANERLAFNQIAGMLCVALVQGERKAPVVVIFPRGQKKPALVYAAHLRYAEVPGLSDEATLGNFRRALVFIAKRVPGLSLDRESHQFLKVGGLRQVDAAGLKRLSGLMGGQLESAPEEPDDFFADLEPAIHPSEPTNPFSAEFPELRQAPTPTTNPPPTPSLSPAPTAQAVRPRNSLPAASPCPNCSFTLHGEDECPACGIVVERFLQRKEARRAEEAPVHIDAPPIPPDEQPEPDEDRDDASDQDDLFISIDALFFLAFQLLKTHLKALAGMTVAILFVSVGFQQVVSIIFRAYPLFTGFLNLAVSLSASVFLLMSLLVYLDNHAEGSPCTISDAFSIAGKLLPVALLSRLGAIGMSLLGFFCFLLPGFVYLLRYALIEVACVMESTTNFAGPSRISRNLQTGRELSVTGVFLTQGLLGTLIFYLPLFALALLSGKWLIPGLFNGFTLVLLMLWFLAFAMAAFMFSAAVLYYLYLELRYINKERMYDVPPRLDLLTRVVIITDVVLFVYFALKLM